MFHKRYVKHQKMAHVVYFSVKFTLFLSIQISLSTLFLLDKSNFLEFSCNIRPTKRESYINMSKILFDGKESFYDYQIIANLTHSHSSNCELCNINKDETGTSTERDIAIAILFGNKTYNVLNWVRTLRSTGCRCKILFFYEKGYLSNFCEDELKAIRNCGVLWWPLGTIFSNKKEVFDPRTSRFLVIQSFLEAYGNYFDRVLLNDIFDSIFQKDPFFDGMPEDKISVSIERVQFKNHELNMKWIQSIDKEWTIEFWNEKWILNSGMQIGPTDLMLELLFLMNQPEFYLDKNNPTDQASLNLLYYRGIFPNIWIDYYGKHFISSCYSMFELKSDKEGFMHEIGFSQNTASIIHQFDRICPVAKNLEKICPKIGKWQKHTRGRPGIYMQVCEKYRNDNYPCLKIEENDYLIAGCNTTKNIF